MNLYDWRYFVAAQIHPQFASLYLQFLNHLQIVRSEIVLIFRLLLMFLLAILCIFSVQLEHSQFVLYRHLK